MCTYGLFSSEIELSNRYSKSFLCSINFCGAIISTDTQCIEDLESHWEMMPSQNASLAYMILEFHSDNNILGDKILRMENGSSLACVELEARDSYGIN